MYYLRSDVVMEPLFNQWYAWSFLISPITAAMVSANLHMRLMKSYLDDPDLHISASQDPNLRGGPFMGYTGPVENVRAALTQMQRDAADVLELARSIKELDKIIQTCASGFSLEPLYQEIPILLKGMVELVYDTHDHASIRFVEPLFYGSSFYRRDLQSVSLRTSSGDERPFVFSTPRIDGEGEVRLRAPFADADFDRIFAMRSAPGSQQDISELEDRFALSEDQRSLFRTFFTSATPLLGEDREYRGNGVRVRYFAHASVLIETAGVTVMLDPIVSYRIEGGVARYTYEDLPDRIDYVILTHGHQDHVMLETLLQIRGRVRTVVVPANSGGSIQDPSLRLMLQAVGFQDVVELSEFQTLPIAEGSITPLPFFGEHADLDIRSKAAFRVELAGITFLSVVDSKNLDPFLYQRLSEHIGRVDVLFLGMECDGAPMSWLYGPLFTQTVDRRKDQDRRLNGCDFTRARAIVDSFDPKETYVYAMGLEPWLSFIGTIPYDESLRPVQQAKELVSYCKSKRITSELLYGSKTFEYRSS